MSHSAISMAEMALAMTRLAGKEAAPQHHLPQVLDSTRVLADQQRFEVLDGAHDRQLATRQPGLAHAVDALVGIYDDEQVVPLAVVHRERGDVGDLHLLPG